MYNLQLIKTNYLELQKSMDVLIDNYNKGNFLPHKIGSTRRFLISGYINLIKAAYSLNEPISVIKLYLNE